MTLGACGKGNEPAPSGDARFEITVSPLRLAAVREVRYGLTVKRNGGDVVWSKDGVLSSDYGDGKGALAYIGPCDASAGSNPHTVELVIEAVQEEGGGDIPFQNPAPEGQPLIVEASCRPNGDTPVKFDLTIMRDASQGFFDVGVQFSDIFCSAKFDCLDDDGGDLELLFNGRERDRSVVLGFACTAGPNNSTWLHLSDVHVECDPVEGPGPRVVRGVAPLGEGNLGPVTPFFFETASYHGEESLPDVDKCYWNMAFGVLEGQSTKNCRLRVTGTASDATWEERDGWSPPQSVYPFIAWDIPLTGPDGVVSCEHDALNAEGSNVTTGYTSFEGGKFDNEWKCGAPVPVTEKVACDATIDGMNQVAKFAQSPQGITVAFGAEPPSEMFKLPTGWTGVDSCCFNACCTDGTPQPTDL